MDPENVSSTITDNCLPQKSSSDAFLILRMYIHTQTNEEGVFSLVLVVDGLVVENWGGGFH